MSNGVVTLSRRLVRALPRADRVAVLTGAGTSAESGVPTFRDAQTGLWARYRAEDLATPEAFARDPETVWRWYQWRRETVRAAKPNPGHYALAELQQRLPRLDLITQNVDGLHQRAGSTNVIELHGNILRSVCSRTGWLIEPDYLASRDETPPPSPHCDGGLARPDVVWFGEALPGDALERATTCSRECQVMLVVGTSGIVQPAASLPLLAVDAGALVIEINPEPSALSGVVSDSFSAPFARALPALLAALD